jgi:serine/threonine protein kinase
MLEPGTKLGRYEIRSQLGAGGMREVCLAQDTRLDRKVALKILPDEVAADPDRMKRFVQEARAASRSNHPNIITIYEIEQADSTPFIAAEFIEGATLRERMRGQPLPLAEVLNVAIQIAGALAAAHASGIVHRDIKPENIILRNDCIAKVLDFGLAKLTGKGSLAIDSNAPTLAHLKTGSGVVNGHVCLVSLKVTGEKLRFGRCVWRTSSIRTSVTGSWLTFITTSDSKTLPRVNSHAGSRWTRRATSSKR